MIPGHQEFASSARDGPLSTGAEALLSEHWMHAIGERGGPLITTADRFVRSWLQDPYPPSGRDALRLLAHEVDELTEDAEADHRKEHDFVDGAGAFLGLVLIDRLGGRHRQHEGTHRVQLGRHGFFDPFGAIDSALDAEAPRRELASRIALAESEAEDHGPVARVVTAFEQALVDRSSDLTITWQFELQLKLGDIDVDLQRVAETTRDQDFAAVKSAADRVAAMLRDPERKGDRVPWNEAKARLLPRLVGADFGNELDAERRDQLAVAPLAQDIQIALVLSYDGRMRYVTASDLQHWGIDGRTARAIAVRNLAARSGDARFGCVDTSAGPMVVASSGDGLDASRLLLPGLNDVLTRELSPPLVAVVPHRDTLIACSANDEGVVEAVRERAARDHARAPHAISHTLVHLASDGIQPWR